MSLVFYFILKKKNQKMCIKRVDLAQDMSRKQNIQIKV